LGGGLVISSVAAAVVAVLSFAAGAIAEVIDRSYANRAVPTRKWDCASIDVASPVSLFPEQRKNPRVAVFAHVASDIASAEFGIHRRLCGGHAACRVS
jgi:hypothetical protein